MAESLESLERRISDLTEMLSANDKIPGSVSLATIMGLFNELSVMNEFFRRDDVIVRIEYEKRRYMDFVTAQSALLQRMVTPDIYEIPEIHDYICTGIYECDKCGKDKIAMRCATAPRPVKTMYKCLNPDCMHTETITVLPDVAAAIRRHGKQVDLDDVKIKPKKQTGELTL